MTKSVKVFGLIAVSNGLRPKF